VSFVPNAGNAFIDPAKLTYLLVTHRGKAKFFALCGFDPTRPEELADTLQWHVYNRHYDSSYTTVHGTKYVVNATPQRRPGAVHVF
jgi:hypothetical protein